LRRSFFIVRYRNNVYPANSAVDTPGEEAAVGEDEDSLNYDDVDDPDAFA
jgi:hypothetical protein